MSKHTQPTQPEHNDMALASFVIGLIGIIAALIPPFLYFSLICGPFGILGAVLGGMSLRQMAGGKGSHKERGLAIAGVIMGLLPITALAVIFVYNLLTGQIDSSVLP